ncbi:MAG: type VI secretion system protein ImpG [Pseudohongiellaceae bacterium]|jgi:type VI secretion system protein ImpG
MDESLLSYFNRELTYIRKMGADFSEKHPKIAGRIRLDKNTVEDPHVSRLIESFAFLTAKIRHQLDDSFPELTEALMGQLYPDYHAPIPSMSIFQFRAIPEVPTASVIEKGTAFYTQPTAMGKCYYHNSYDTDVLPVAIKGTQFVNAPFKAPPLPVHLKGANNSRAILKLQIEPLAGNNLADFTVDNLRFYIHGQPHISFKLYEYMMSHATAVVLSGDDDEGNKQLIHLPSSVLSPCGLNEKEAVIPFDGRTSSAHRLLAEYFAFSNKFLFFNLSNMLGAWEKLTNGFSIYIYFNKTHPELVQGVSDNTLLLGCTPVINLFDQSIETIDTSGMGIESQLRVSRAGSEYVDVHSIQSIFARNPEGKEVALKPFYGSHQNLDESKDSIYWCLRRENSKFKNGAVSQGTETFVSFVDKTFKTIAPDSQWFIGANVLCTNRDAPSKLPFGPNQPEIGFMGEGAGLRIKCLIPPTATLQPLLGDATRWQLTTQLSLQSFSQHDGLEALKDVLKLYDFRGDDESKSILDGIRSLTTEMTTARIIQQGRSAICQGTHITISFDEQHYSGDGLYLFSALLSEFFAQICAINSFTQLTVNIQQRPGQKISWPPKNGEQALV